MTQTTTEPIALAERPPEGRITPEAIEAARNMIGTYLRPEGPFLQDVTGDTMRIFCNGCGDLNPLYRDAEYGRRSRWGTQIAHPLMPTAYGYIGRTRWGFPGVHGFHAGNDWEFFRVWRPGDRMNCLERIVGVEVKESRFSGTLAIQYTEATFTNQRDELVARVLGWCTRHERKAARDTGKYAAIETHRYEPGQIEAIEEEVLKEPSNIRGDQIRYVEDVAVGEELPAVVRGPLSMMDLTGFHVGTARGLTHGLVVAGSRRHPGHYFRNPDAGGGLEYTGIGHQRENVAKEVGVPSGYDYGPQRMTWLATLVTNWMGDGAFIKRVRGEMRRFNIVGDTTWCKGKVSKKYSKDGYGLVDLEIWAENQRGETTSPGFATVMLPSRDIHLKPVVDGSDLSLDLPPVR